MDQQPSKKATRKRPRGTTRADGMVTRQRILELVLQGRKPIDIASEVGIALQHVYKYTSDPTFKEEIKQHHRDRLKAMSLRSDGLLEQALTDFEGLIGDNTAPYRDRLAAIRLALDLNQRLDENTHLAEELEELKAAIEAKGDIFDAIEN